MQRRMLLATTASMLATPAAWSQARFPTCPVTVIVPFAAGGPTDVITRMVAEPLSRDLGQPVVVENVSGAAAPSARGASRRPGPTATPC